MAGHRKQRNTGRRMRSSPHPSQVLTLTWRMVDKYLSMVISCHSPFVPQIVPSEVVCLTPVKCFHTSKWMKAASVCRKSVFLTAELSSRSERGKRDDLREMMNQSFDRGRTDSVNEDVKENNWRYSLLNTHTTNAVLRDRYLRFWAED